MDTESPFRVIICVDVDCFEEQVWKKHLYQDYIDHDIPIVIRNQDSLINTILHLRLLSRLHVPNVHNPTVNLFLLTDSVSKNFYQETERIVSINYSARAPPYEISRRTSKKDLEQLKQKFREVKVLETGTRNGQCDTFTPFKESDFIMNSVREAVVKYRGVLAERASPDEVFLDITDALPYIRDWDKCTSDDQLFNARKHFPCKEHDGRPRSILYSGAAATCGYYTGQDIRNRIGKNVSSEEESIIRAGIFSEWLLDTIYKETGYYCSAGVGPNKLIAKVASDLNKPAGVAMMTTQAFIKKTSSLAYDKLPGLKRNSGEEMRDFYEHKMRRQLKFVSQIQELSLDQLCEFYREKGEQALKAQTLHDRVRGKDRDPVKHKIYDNSMGFSYTFRGSRRAQKQDVKDMARERLDYLVECQGRLPEHILLRIKFETKDGTGEIKESLPVNRDQCKLVLKKFINNVRIANDIDLEIVKKLQLRAMNLFVIVPEI